MNTFAQRLLYARTQRGYTQSQLANLCGVSQSTIASYESGARLHTRNLFNLAKALRVNPLWLDQGIGAMHPTLQESNQSYSQTWPFSRVSPDKINQLTDQQRILIENVLATLIETWEKQK